MQLESTLTNRSNQTLKIVYKEDDPLKDYLMEEVDFLKMLG